MTYDMVGAAEEGAQYVQVSVADHGPAKGFASEELTRARTANDASLGFKDMACVEGIGLVCEDCKMRENRTAQRVKTAVVSYK